MRKRHVLFIKSIVKFTVYRNETKWKKAIDINNILIMIFIVSGSSVILFIEFI